MASNAYLWSLKAQLEHRLAEVSEMQALVRQGIWERIAAIDAELGKSLEVEERDDGAHGK